MNLQAALQRFVADALGGLHNVLLVAMAIGCVVLVIWIVSGIVGLYRDQRR